MNLSGKTDLLRKDGEEIAFGEVERDATGVNVSGVFVFGVPGRLVGDA